MTQRSGTLGLLLSLLAVPFSLQGQPLGQALIKPTSVHQSLVGPVLMTMPTPEQQEMLIRMAYDRVAEAMNSDGADLEFEIRIVRTVFPSEFFQVKFDEFATVGAGLKLEWGHHRSWEGDRLIQLEYRPRWAEAPEWPDNEDERRLVHGLSLAQWLTENASLVNPDQARVITAAAVTLYDVQATMFGSSRRFRASAVWLPPSAGELGETVATFLDEITPELTRALAGDLPLAFKESPESAPTPLEGTFAAAAGGSCEASTETHTEVAGNLSTSGHNWGSHNAGVRVEFRCTCDTACKGQCVASIVPGSDYCDDFGALKKGAGYKHVKSIPDTDAGRDTVLNSTESSRSARCGGGVGCAFIECMGVCAKPTITVQWGALGLEVTAKTFGAFTVTAPHTLTCDYCRSEPCPTLKFGDFGDLDAASSPCDEPTTDSCENPPCNSTPILIDLDGNNFHLSSLEDGVLFDILANNSLQLVSWTTADSEDAFLVLDRNSNGRVDDATELFGEHTLNQAADANGANGYAALKGLDPVEKGGNNDGWISVEDGVFASLRLWVDANHDGVSQPGELAPLSDYDIEAISYDYKESRRRDATGNEFRFRAPIRYANSAAPGKSVDVFLRYTRPPQ